MSHWRSSWMLDAQGEKPSHAMHVPLSPEPGATTGGLARLDEANLKALGFQQLEERNPANPSRFDSDRVVPPSLNGTT